MGYSEAIFTQPLIPHVKFSLRENCAGRIPPYAVLTIPNKPVDLTQGQQNGGIGAVAHNGASCLMLAMIRTLVIV